MAIDQNVLRLAKNFGFGDSPGVQPHKLMKISGQESRFVSVDVYIHR